MARKKPVVREIDYHRNWVSGTGFVVALVDHPENGRMLCIDFDPDGDGRGLGGCFAALNIDQAAAGNVYMHTHGDHAGGNAFRGDVLADELRPLLREALEFQQRKELGHPRQ